MRFLILSAISLVLSANAALACSQSQDQLLVNDPFSTNIVICDNTSVTNDALFFSYTAAEKSFLSIDSEDLMCGSVEYTWQTKDDMGKIINEVPVTRGKPFIADPGFKQQLKVKMDTKNCDFAYLSFYVETF
jgi:hypothetical protein